MTQPNLEDRLALIKISLGTNGFFAWTADTAGESWLLRGGSLPG